MSKPLPLTTKSVPQEQPTVGEIEDNTGPVGVEQLVIAFPRREEVAKS